MNRLDLEDKDLKDLNLIIHKEIKIEQADQEVWNIDKRMMKKMTEIETLEIQEIILIMSHKRITEGPMPNHKMMLIQTKKNSEKI